VPVVICFTGAWLRARRAASLSVARSPTSAATLYRERKSVSVFSRKAVLPEPGLETRLITEFPPGETVREERGRPHHFVSKRFSELRRAAAP